MSAVDVNLSGRVVLVTGAAGGIGRTLAARALDAGAQVAAFDLEASPIRHANLLPLQGDVTCESDVVEAIAQVRARWNRLDVLINNAGRAGSGRVESLALDDWRSTIETNLTGVFLFCKHSIPLLRASKGAIVSLSSTNGLTGGSHLSGPAYAAAKAAILALTKHLARDLAGDGVRANAVAPGPIDTPMLARLGEDGIAALRRGIPLGEIGATDDVAHAVLFLASSAARHITGVTLSVSGGLVMH
jgi:NAD(P)-dependent dehydrogenase (short-subunit alcohol dehydrogenase family)